MSSMNPYKKREKPLKSMITLVKIDKVKEGEPGGYLEKL